MSKAKIKLNALDKLKNRVRGNKSPLAVLIEERGELPESYYPKLIEWLPSVYRNGRRAFYHPFPPRLEDLCRLPVLEAVDLRREIIWARVILSEHSKRIRGFLERSQQYEDCLLYGSYKDCHQLLDGIERDFGFSLWVIENRLVLLQQSEGLEKQKAYMQSIREARGSYDLVSYSTLCTSYRNEDTVTPQNFRIQISDRLDSMRIDPGFRTYLYFRIADVFPDQQDGIGSILRYEATCSLVDYYDTFIRLASHCILKNLEIQSVFVSEIKSLVGDIDDPRLIKLLYLADCDSVLKLPSFVDPVPNDLFASGQYKEMLAYYEDKARLKNQDLEWTLHAHALAEEGTTSQSDFPNLYSRIAHLGSLVIARSEGLQEAVSTLGKLGLNFHLMRFGSSLDAFCAEELSSDPILEKSEPVLLKFVNSKQFTPGIFKYLPSKKCQNHYSGLLISSYGPSRSCFAELSKSTVDMPPELAHKPELLEGLSNDIRAEIGMERALAVRSYADVLKLSDDQAAAIRPRARRNAARFKAHALLMLGRTKELVDFIVTTYLDDSSMLRTLPIRECARLLDKPTRRVLKDNISVPILLDLYSRYISDDLDKFRAFAYEDFLKSYGLKRPSELQPRLEQYNSKAVTYYLKNLCVPPIMRVSTVFKSTRDLEDERLEVLAILMKIDGSNSVAYEAEIHDITRSQMIRYAVRHVEQSKISMDLPALRRWAEKNIKESFSRYKALLKAGMSGEGESVLQALKGVVIEALSHDETLEVPRNEALDLLSSSLFLLFRECTLSPEHGLDCYLSIRIRHGTLSGQLRSPLEKWEIIAQRTSGSNEYKSNVVWMDRLAYLGTEVCESIDECLKDFAKAYDSFIEKIANELIQVRSDEKKEGLFQITDESDGRAKFLGIDLKRFSEFVLAIKEDTSFPAFLDLCFELFWESVESCLENVRHLIDTSLKIEFNNLFTKVENDLARIAGHSSVSDLSDAIRTARTEGQEALDLVIDWFRLSKPLATSAFSFQDLVDIGLQYVKKLHPEFAPVISHHYPDLPLIEGGLDKFPDIFIIVFDNIRRHSRILGNPAVDISVTTSPKSVHVTIRNEVGPEVRTEETERKVCKIKESILTGLGKSALRSEGGTGFIKLRKLIGGVERTTSSLDFGFGDDGRFYVELEVPILHLQGAAA